MTCLIFIFYHIMLDIMMNNDLCGFHINIRVYRIFSNYCPMIELHVCSFKFLPLAKSQVQHTCMSLRDTLIRLYFFFYAKYSARFCGILPKNLRILKILQMLCYAASSNVRFWFILAGLIKSYLFKNDKFNPQNRTFFFH